MTVRISGLFVYPLKSGAGIEVTARDLDARGLVGDREYMVVDSDGRFLTQREVPQLALVSVQGSSVITPVGTATVQAGSPVTVTVWDYTGPATDCADQAADLLSEYLGRTCRLVRVPAGHTRRSDDGRTGIGFSDGYPLLLISEESLADLNSRLEQPLPMNRFRPNVVVSGCDPYAEDTWREIVLGDVPAEIVKPCQRCSITRVDQATGRRLDTEPLKTLATYRRVPGGVIFGQNVVHAGPGALRVGDEVRISGASPRS